MSNSAISFKNTILLMITVTFWASAFVGIRAGVQSYSPGALALLRYIVAAFCMFFIYHQFAKKHFIPTKDKLWLMLIGAIGVGAYNLVLNYGEMSVTSGTASFVVSQAPIISSLLAIFFLGERVNALGFFGMFVSVFGVFLISLGEEHGLRWQDGMLYILLATFLCSIFTISQKPFLKKYHAIDVTSYIIWGAMFSLLVYTPDMFREIKTASLHATLGVVYLGVFPAAIAYVTWGYALTEVSASRAMSFLYVSPVITLLLGWLYLGEIPAMISMVGGAVALLGVLLVGQSSQVRQKLKA